METSLERQFIGQARLIRLLLWKIGNSTDLDICIDSAISSGMINADDEGFIRNCLDAEEDSRASGALSFEVTDETLIKLRRFADKMNRADSA